MSAWEGGLFELYFLVFILKTSYFNNLKIGEIVQRLEHWNHNPNVVGSNPSFAIMIKL